MIFTNSAATASHQLCSQFLAVQKMIFKFAVLPAVMPHFQRLAMELDRRRSNIWEETDLWVISLRNPSPIFPIRKTEIKKHILQFVNNFFEKRKIFFQYFVWKQIAFLFSLICEVKNPIPPPLRLFFKIILGYARLKFWKLDGVPLFCLSSTPQPLFIKIKNR